jgi:hypothetical protein
VFAGDVAGPSRTELDRLYRQWRDRENGPVKKDLHTAVWIFTTKYAGEDLGHDVCLRVVRELNRLPDRMQRRISFAFNWDCHASLDAVHALVEGTRDWRARRRWSWRSSPNTRPGLPSTTAN